jgi:hypothetical protein
MKPQGCKIAVQNAFTDGASHCRTLLNAMSRETTGKYHVGNVCVRTDDAVLIDRVVFVISCGGKEGGGRWNHEGATSRAGQVRIEPISKHHIQTYTRTHARATYVHDTDTNTRYLPNSRSASRLQSEGHAWLIPPIKHPTVPCQTQSDKTINAPSKTRTTKMCPHAYIHTCACTRFSTNPYSPVNGPHRVRWDCFQSNPDPDQPAEKCQSRTSRNYGRRGESTATSKTTRRESFVL